MHDRIWAPWRARYIQETATSSQPHEECFLCRGLASDSLDDLIVLRCANSFVVLNRYPYNNGHLLVAPRVHRATLRELSGAELLEPLQTIQKMIVILDRMIRPEGYNIGLNQGRASGAGLPGHLHWHVVPRWDGDTNFMPIVAGSKVINESLRDFHDRIRVEIEREPA